VRIMCDEYELEVRLEDEIFVEMVAGLQLVGPATSLHPAWRTHAFKILTATANEEPVRIQYKCLVSV
jgi:hypothetical protein